MAKRKIRLGTGVTCAFSNFPSCCSAVLMSGVGITRASSASIPAGVVQPLADFSQHSQQILSRHTANARMFPVRIWYAFLVQQMLERAFDTSSNKPRMFIISDRVSSYSNVNRLNEDALPNRGSGVGEYLRRVPGFKVTRTPPYKGAHGGYCRTYNMELNDQLKVEAWSKDTLDYANRLIKQRRKAATPTVCDAIDQPKWIKEWV